MENAFKIPEFELHLHCGSKLDAEFEFECREVYLNLIEIQRNVYN